MCCSAGTRSSPVATARCAYPRVLRGGLPIQALEGTRLDADRPDTRAPGAVPRRAGRLRPGEGPPFHDLAVPPTGAGKVGTWINRGCCSPSAKSPAARVCPLARSASTPTLNSYPHVTVAPLAIDADADAVARLELVRTLRTLDVDLPTIARVLDQHAQLTAVAALHAEAIATQIRTLRLRRGVLLAVVKHPDPTGAVIVMTRLAEMSETERQDLINAFWDEMCDGMAVQLARDAVTRICEHGSPSGSKFEPTSAPSGTRSSSRSSTDGHVPRPRRRRSAGSLPPCAHARQA
jgi:hypothetical protein